MTTLGPRVGKWPPPPRLQIPGAFIRRSDWSGANMTGADLRGTDAKNAVFVGVDFKDADLTGTNLQGADLTDAKNLTEDQLASAIIDDDTRLPSYIDRSRLAKAASN